MKINKILAAGIAATLAVTSLSAVASAEEHKLTWKMDYTFSKVQWNNTKMFWLGDNDYIGGAGYGAAATAKAIIKADFALASFTNLFKTDGGVITIEDSNADGKSGLGKLKVISGGNNYTVLVKNGDLANPADALTCIATDNRTASAAAITAALADVNGKYLTNIGTNAKAALAAFTAATAGAVTGADESQYTASKTVGDAKACRNYLQAVSDELKKAIAAVDGLGTDGAAAKAKLTTEKGIVDAAITQLDATIRDAEDVLIGAPLLENKEIGGIKISTAETPLVAGKTGTNEKYVQITGAKLILKGTKRGSTASESGTWDFQQAYKSFTNHIGNEADKDKALYLAFAPKYINRPAFVNLGVFGTITDAEIQISYKLLINEGNAANPVYTEALYYTQKEYDDAKKVALATLKADTTLSVYDNLEVDDTETFDLKSNDAGWKTSYTQLANDTTNLYKLYKALQNSVITGDVEENSKSQETRQPFVRMTTGNTENDIGKTITRDLVKVLSDTADYRSSTSNNGVWGGIYDGNTQTYDDAGMGTQPRWFAGLASQVADFFNKQNNGQITFQFKDPALASQWVSYGVPSTEVGLRTLQGTAMALFFNYKSTTGSIQSIGVVDKDAWTITFDMANVLDDFGGLTKGSLTDIYYGLNTGLKYGKPYDGYGYVVENVTLTYDDSPAAVDATTDDDAAVVVADDDDDVVADDDDDIFADDDVVADDDDDDDAGIIEDDDDDDTDVNNDVDYVDGADDDANPGTGVGLAVIPAIVAAAAAIVSKKRK